MKTLYSTGKKYIEFDLDLIAESEKAILVSDGITEVQIPKSQLEDDYEDLSNGMIRIVIPEWLATEKGLI